VVVAIVAAVEREGKREEPSPATQILWPALTTTSNLQPVQSRSAAA